MRGQPADIEITDPGGRQAAQLYLPRFEFLLDDLAGTGEDQLLARELTPAALDTLNGWFRRAFKAGKASDLFQE